MIFKNLLLFSLIFFFASCSSTGTYLVNTLAKLGNYKTFQDISYNPYNKLDIYIPTDLSKPAPVVVFFYGGCWGACQNTSKEDYEFLADALTQKGYIVVIPDYRYYPEASFKTIISDASESVQWVKNKISSYKGDDDKIILMGHSAGAHIAIMLSVKDEYLQTKTYNSIKAGIGLAGPYDFIPYTEPYMEGVFGPEPLAAYSQPINFIEGNEPPLLLLYGRQDTTIKPKNIINLTKIIKKKKGRVKALYYKDLDHVGIISGFSRPLREDKLVDDVNNFIQSL